MRSPYEDSAAVSADSSSSNSNSKYHTSYSYNSHTSNNNNNNNNYHKNHNGNGIPYHARENSLPFSYGNAKAATPLRKTPTPTRADSFLDFDFGLSSSSSSNNNNNSSNNHNNNYNGSSGNASDMIKPQPRLTSPLLVRKTLGGSSRSATNGNTNGLNAISNPNTNTISNTYHYGTTTTTAPTATATATPPRVDLEQLLGERRDKVYSEYRMREKERELERELERVAARVPPTPPQRRQSNGQSHNKYNYDFEFNLNLNDVNDRSPLPAPAPYNTRNIEYRQDVDVPDGAIGGTSRRLESTIVERNYHTINSGHNGSSSSSSISRANNNHFYNSNNNGTNNNNSKNSTNNNNSHIYSSYSSNYSQSLERPPMEVTYKQLAEPHLEQQANIYGQNQLHLETHTRSRRDLSPIYATSSKRNTAAAAPHSHSGNGHQPDHLLTPSPTSRPETPAFPVTPRTPFGSSTLQRTSPTANESIYQTMASNRQRLNSAPSPTFEVAADLVKFARNSAKFWYKPMLSREDAIALLMNAPPGTFLVRDSTTYANAYGLVLRVAQPPAGSQELVRHFLIEPTQRGVHLKGCDNEPTFTSLSALIYEHSINKLALPCLLRIPEADVVPALAATTPAQQQLLTHGAATNVLWLFSCDTESLTGNEAIRKAIRQMYAQKPLPTPTEVHFKVSGQGITLTDNTRKKFFRKHYTADVISHCAIDPENRMWSDSDSDKKTIFAFVARRSHSSKDNQCHVFCDLSVAQPAVAIVSFANRTLPVEKQRNYVL